MKQDLTDAQSKVRSIENDHIKALLMSSREFVNAFFMFVDASATAFEAGHISEREKKEHERWFQENPSFGKMFSAFTDAICAYQEDVRIVDGVQRVSAVRKTGSVD